MVEVRWTDRALEDLREIRDFIARDSPSAAERVVDRLFRASERLIPFPEMGRRLPEFPESPYREVVVSSYRMMYRREGGIVWIAAVVHGRRDLPSPP